MNVDVDYMDSASWDVEMPARMAWLRENAPIYWAEKSNLWVISKYDDVLEVSKDQTRSSMPLPMAAARFWTHSLMPGGPAMRQRSYRSLERSALVGHAAAHSRAVEASRQSASGRP